MQSNYKGIGNEEENKITEQISVSIYPTAFDLGPNAFQNLELHNSVKNKNMETDEDKHTFSANGRWTDDEHERFLKGLQLYGRSWKKVKKYVGTRSATQVRSHAQKYFTKFQNSLTGSIGQSKDGKINGFHSPEDLSVRGTRVSTPIDSPIEKPHPAPIPLIQVEEVKCNNALSGPVRRKRELDDESLPKHCNRVLFSEKTSLKKKKVSHHSQKDRIHTDVIAVEDLFADPEFENFMLESENNCEVPIIQLQAEVESISTTREDNQGTISQVIPNSLSSN